MLNDKKEVEHIIDVLEKTKRALKEEDTLVLSQLSDQTIHAASIEQHTDSITMAVLLYSLTKLIARKSRMKLKNWSSFVNKFNAELDRCITELKKRDMDEFVRHLDHARGLMETFSPALKTNVEEVFKKASLNKASRIYEHGISLHHTARLLNVSQWELAEYIGQQAITENPYNMTIDIKKRAKTVMDFFK